MFYVNDEMNDVNNRFSDVWDAGGKFNSFVPYHYRLA